MANIYISYSSRDERAVLGLKSWLREHGYEAVLVARKKQQEQGAFDELEPVLLEAIEKSELVLLLVTPFWEASKLCQWELAKVQSLKKSHMAILEAPSNVELADGVPVIDMTRSRDNGLNSLREQLKGLLSTAPAPASAAKQAKLVKPAENRQDPSDIALQGPVIARHNRGKTRGENTWESPAPQVSSQQESVNRTLKILQKGIRWSAFPGWLTRFLNLPVAGTRIKERALRLTSFRKKLSFGSLARRAASWVTGGTARMAGVAFILFICATALLAMMSDGPLGSKSIMRKELADVKKRQSLFLTRIANHLRGTGDLQNSLLLGLEALDGAQGEDDRFKARDALYSAFVRLRTDLVLKGHDNHVSGAMFSPDGRYVLSSSWDRTARIWQLAAPHKVRVIDEHEGFVNTARYNRQQTLILTAALDNKARLFDARTGKLVHVLKGHNHDLTSASFSLDGQRIVTASGDQTARIWEVAGGKLLRSFLGHKAALEYAEFSPDSRRIATACDDKMGRLLDVETGNQLAVLKGHTDIVRMIRFSPSGKLIATASEDKSVRLWEAKSGVFLRALKGHDWAVLSAEFSPNGKHIVTASKDKTARIWDVASGRLLQVLRGHKGIVSAASYAPDGRRVVTASGDGTLRLWPLFKSDDALAKAARKVAGHCLTSEQRKKYFLSEKVPDWCAKFKRRAGRK